MLHRQRRDDGGCLPTRPPERWKLCERSSDAVFGGCQEVNLAVPSLTSAQGLNAEEKTEITRKLESLDETHENVF